MKEDYDCMRYIPARMCGLLQVRGDQIAEARPGMQGHSLCLVTYYGKLEV